MPEPCTEENPLGMYRLTPERVRYLDAGELSQRRLAARNERALRLRWLYEALDLRVVVFPDGSLSASVFSGVNVLVTVFEAIHDLSQPVEVLMTARKLAGEDGAVIVMDERVTETFAAPGNLIERFFYGASMLFCLPIGMAEQPSAGTGTAMRPDVLRVYATEAGFGDVEILPIDHDMWRFYRLLS